MIRGFRQLPRGVFLDIAVGPNNEQPQLGQRAGQIKFFHACEIRSKSFLGFRLQIRRRSGGHNSLPVAVEHRERAIDEVPQLVGEVGVVHFNKLRLGKIAVVGCERPIASQIIPERVQPIGRHIAIDPFEVNEVAEAFAHLLAFTDPEAMRIHMPGQRPF